MLVNNFDHTGLYIHNCFLFKERNINIEMKLKNNFKHKNFFAP